MIRTIILGSAATLLLLVGPAPAAESNGAIQQSCAMHDLTVFNLIEQNAEAETIKAENLADAFIEVLAARRLCGDGRLADALRIYDSVGQKLSGGVYKANVSD
jgi:hypothetical protein